MRNTIAFEEAAPGRGVVEERVKVRPSMDESPRCNSAPAARSVSESPEVTMFEGTLAYLAADTGA